MTISSGTRLGPYEILAPIGAGGMGEVYKARDTRLDRSVAVKILPAEFAQNAQLKVRFEREAKTISQLTHPNICTLYDVGDNYLVMELLDGESLADRLARGPLSFAEVLRYGAQIADALAQAHRAGIVHRDLKPGNVMITKAGAKLLDFGLAKPGAQPIDIEGATQHKSLTSEGTIVGTFQYMSPEQLEGLDADPRTDIFALGTVLYEMTTGKRAFDGKTKTSLIASIVSGTPKPISAIVPVTPPAFEHVIAKCLEKDRDDRWQSAHDVAEELRWIATQQAKPDERRAPRGGGWIAAAIVALIAIAAIAWMRSRTPKPRVMYSDLNAPEDAVFAFDNGAATISPDGTMIVFPAISTGGGLVALWVRGLDGSPPRILKGTENAAYPFWSADSKWIGFYADAKLKKVEVATGTMETLVEAASGRGGAWNADNVILYSPSPAEGLFRVSASGGTSQPVTRLNTTRGDSSHRYPVFLGDGRHFLVFVQGPTEGGNVLLGSLDSNETKLVGTADGGLAFAAPDIVLMVRDRVLRAQRMNMKTFAWEGDPIAIAENIQISSTFNYANVSASQTGVLTYVSGISSTTSEVAFFDATGKRLSSVGVPADQTDPRLSPDGSTVLIGQNAGSSSTSDIWAYDLRRNIATRLTFSPANDFAPVWSPDGKSMVYTSFDHSPGDLFIKRIDANGSGRVLLSDHRRKVATDWSRDGKYVIYHVVNPKTVWDIEAYSIPEHKVIPLVVGPTGDVEGRLSPDGKWLAFVSNDTGHGEVFVQRFPTSAERWQVSGGGGNMPCWSRDGRHLFYMTLDAKMMQADVHPNGDEFAAATPRALFPTGIRLMAGVTRIQYDVAADGRFLINVASMQAKKPLAVTLVQNWTERLRR